MQKEKIKIEIKSNKIDGSCKIENLKTEKFLEITLTEKIINAQDVYDLLDYSRGKVYNVDAPNFAEEDLIGKENEINRLLKDVYNLIYEVLKKVNILAVE